MNNKVSVFRIENFNSAHRLNNPAWDEATNERIFGKCNNLNYHGHNYELVVKLSGVPDLATGYVYDLKILRDLIRENILEKFDHKNLNPSAENIAIVIYNILREKIEIKFDLQIRLYETPKNFVEYPVN